MIIAKPDETYEQHKDDIVIYRLEFTDWSRDVNNPDDTRAVIRIEAVRGHQVIATFQVLPYQAGQRWHDVRVSGGLRNSSYHVVRTVKSIEMKNVPSESRRRAFTVNVK
jgi:hypothetical protein